jgi:DNA-binding NtrC family response regulator
LRAIQEKRIRSVGSDRDRPVACRVIAATHADIQHATTDNTFRRDLYYRLAVIRLQVPPLRERGSDILSLAEHFVAVAADRMGAPVTGISTQAARVLLTYDWPGNVRELQNAMERAVAMADGDLVAPMDLPEELGLSSSSAVESLGLVSLETAERAHVQRVLDHTGGNKKAAAEILQVDRTTLYRKLDRWQNE